jgi:hypothetical protein
MNYTDSPLFLRLLSQSPLSKRELEILIDTAPSRYKEHYIEKRNGRGKRLISQPTAELKFFQRLLVDFELSDLDIHDAATAYRNGRSIHNHAMPHANSKYILKLDFKNFFPSLRASALNTLLSRKSRYTNDELYVICQIACKRMGKSGELSLSIGAPSSPFLSNALMYEFDNRLASHCLRNSVIYTRYADDIALSTSTPGILDETKQFVGALLHECRELNLDLNEEKTVNVSRKRRRVLTGLTLSNDGRASIGRERKRELRAAVHQISTSGKSEMPIDRLKGMLAFLYSLDQAWVLRLCHRHGFDSVAAIVARVDHGSRS